MTEKKTFDEITKLIRVDQKLIWLTSFEETRAQNLVSRVAQSLKRELLIWRRTTGIMSSKGAYTSTLKATDALKKVAGLSNKTIVLLVDFSRHLEDAFNARMIKDLANKITSPHIILLDSSDIPLLDLKKSFVKVNLPTPDAAELKSLLAEVAKGSELDTSHYDLMVLAALGLMKEEARRAFKLAVLNKDNNPVEEVLAQKRKLSTEGSALDFFEQSAEFDHIGGLTELKKWLTKRRRAFGEDARNFGLPPPRGLLLLGVQGCGKSLTAKAVSKLWNVPLLRLDLAMLGSHGGEARLENALALSASVAPAILWIDEIEKGFAEHSSDGSALSSRLLSTFVIWMQEKKAPVFVVATANSISDMPPELLRKGRFDEIFFVDLPSEIEREEIFRIHLTKRDRNPEDFNLKELVRASPGMSGAEIEEAVVSGLYEAFDENDELKQKHIMKSIKATVPLAKTMEEKIKELKDWAKGRARVSSPDTRTEDLLKG